MNDIEEKSSKNENKDNIKYKKNNNFLYFIISIMMVLFIITGSIILAIKKDKLNDNVKNIAIVKMIANFIEKDVYIEVPVESPPDNPEIEIISQYMQSRNSRLSVEICYLISKIIFEKSKEYNIPTNLIIGIIEKESIFNPSATTEIPAKKGSYAKGLMQVYQGENIDIDQDKVYNLGYNIDIGCQIFNKKLDLNNGNFEKALANYSGNAENYTDNVLANAGRYSMFTWKLSYKEKIASEISMKN